jgi:hypothetical protein
MPIDVNSPLWAVLADWIKIILRLPDPPPDHHRSLCLDRKPVARSRQRVAEGSTRDGGPSQGRLGTGVLTAGCASVQITTRDGEDEQ